MPQAAEKLASPASEGSYPPKATTRRRAMHKQCLQLELFGDVARTRLQVRRTLRTTSLWRTYAPIELNSSSLAELNRCPVSHMGNIRSHTMQFSTLATPVELCGGEGKSIGGRTNHCRGHGRDELLRYAGNKDYTSQMIVRISSTCGIPFLDIIATPSPRKVRSKVSHVDVLTQTPCGVPKTSANCVHVKANPPQFPHMQSPAIHNSVEQFNITTSLYTWQVQTPRDTELCQLKAYFSKSIWSDNFSASSPTLLELNPVFSTSKVVTCGSLWGVLGGRWGVTPVWSWCKVRVGSMIPTLNVPWLSPGADVHMVCSHLVFPSWW